MFRGLLVAAVMAAVSLSAQAQVKIFKLEAGHYMVQGDGIVTCQIVSPDTPVPPTPTPTPVDEFSKAVVAAVNKIPATDARHAAAMKLSAVCQVLGEQVTGGKIHPTDGAQAFQLIGKAALAKDAKTWTNVLEVIETALTKATTAESSADVLTTAGVAVLSTVPAAGDGTTETMRAAAEKYGFDWDKFLEFLMQLLVLLLPLITWAKIAAVALLA